jgi:ABC-type multidrug transport system fused ATPase/permease subunit
VRKTLSTYIHAVFEVDRLRIAGAIALMLLFSLSEGIGVAVLLPILQVSGFNLGGQGAVGRYADAIAGAFESAGVHPSLLLECLHALPAFENVIALAERCAAMAEPADAPAETLEFGNSLRMESVSFSYQRANGAVPAKQSGRSVADRSPSPDRSGQPPAVHGLELTVPVGEVLALVGPSGAGKSTIADLMTGLLAPDWGRITVDGVALDETRARVARTDRLRRSGHLPVPRLGAREPAVGAAGRERGRGAPGARAGRGGAIRRRDAGSTP